MPWPHSSAREEASQGYTYICTWFKLNCNYRLCENKASGEDRGLISAQLELKQSLHSGDWYKE